MIAPSDHDRYFVAPEFIRALCDSSNRVEMSEINTETRHHLCSSLPRPPFGEEAGGEEGLRDVPQRSA